MQDVTLYMVDFVSENRRDRIATEDKCDLEDWIVRINKAIELKKCSDITIVLVFFFLRKTLIRINLGIAPVFGKSILGAKIIL